MKKKLLGLFLLLSLLLAGTTALEAKAEEPERYSSEITYVNPLYADVISEDELKSEPSVYYSTGTVEYHETVAEAAAFVRDQMEERAATIVVGVEYHEWTNVVAYEVFNEALAHTGVPTEGDYLAFTYGGWSGNLSGYDDGSTYYITITYNMQYYTTAEQEAEMNTAVDNLLAELNLEAEDDYTKVCGIYDYMCENIVYDYENLNDASHKLKYTAYAALVNGTSVCQGYANLFYRLALELDVDARIISGNAGGPHSWNIVKLGDLYYNLDSTWDAGRSPYDYFLQNPEGFSNHARDPEYETEEFHAAYPMSEVDYEVPEEKLVAVYQGENLLGEYASFEDAFALVTDANGEYMFVILEDESILIDVPMGQWPKAERLGFVYPYNEIEAEYYNVASLMLTGDVYLNSDVYFYDISLNSIYDAYASGSKPTMFAGNYTMYFMGNGNYLGGAEVSVSIEEIYSLGICIEGPEATLVSEAYDRFEMRGSEVNVGTVKMNNWFLVRGGSFVCDTLTFSENVYSMSWSSLYNAEISFDVETMVVNATAFTIHHDMPNDNNVYRIGTLQQGEECTVGILTTTGTGRKIPVAITVENFERLSYNIDYVDVSAHTKEEWEELYAEAVNAGDDSKANFYYDMLWHMTQVERYPSEEAGDIWTYQGALLNIGETDLENLDMYLSVRQDFGIGAGGCMNSFLEVDETGNVFRAKNEVIAIDNGVLTNAEFFGKDKVTLTVPEGVTEIADFPLSAVIEKVVLPESLESTVTGALTQNYVKEFVIAENNPNYVSVDGVLYTKDGSKMVAFPKEKQGDFTVPDTVTEIGDGVFTGGNLKLNKLTIPSSVEEAGVLQFQGNGCKAIEVDSRYVSAAAFINFSGSQITFGPSVEKIWGEALRYSTVKSVYILNPETEFVPETFTDIWSDSVTIYGYTGSTAEEYVATYGEEYGLVFSAIASMDGITDFVTRFYNLILEREPDADGLNTWVNLLFTKERTGVGAAEGFILSDEFLNKEMSNEEFIKIMYRTFLGREADEGGLATWMNLMAQGYQKKFIFSGFANSDEFQTVCDGYGIERGLCVLTEEEKQPVVSGKDVTEFVERLYNQILGRGGDSEGMKTWVDILKKKERSGAQVAEGFILSDEFLAKEMTNAEYVNIMYRTFFGREADSEGFNTWVGLMSQGYTKRFVFAGFANSDEFATLCAEYGIERGTVASE